MENQVAKELPKLLRITKATVTSAVNKHLLNPWRIGEIVRVCPIEEQKSVTKTNVETFAAIHGKSAIPDTKLRLVG